MTEQHKERVAAIGALTDIINKSLGKMRNLEVGESVEIVLDDGREKLTPQAIIEEYITSHILRPAQENPDHSTYGKHVNSAFLVENARREDEVKRVVWATVTRTA